MKSNVIIFGAGDLARTLNSYISQSGRFNVVGFCVDDAFRNKSYYLERPLLGFSDLVENFSSKNCLAILAVGYSNMRFRVSLYDRIKALGFQFANFIHSSSTISEDCDFGEGNIVFPGVIIEPGVKIGTNNIIWSSVNICHDSSIGSHNFIASQSLLGGFSKVGDNCFIGFNSTILHNVSLCDEVLLGAKSLLMTNAVAFGRYQGSPADLVCLHKENGILIK